MSLRSLNPWRGLGGLPRDVWVLCAATLVNRLGVMVLPFLVLYLTRDRGFSAGFAGFILALFGAVSLPASPIAGRLCDRFGPARVMELSLLASGAVLLLYPLAQTAGEIVVATMALSAAAEGARPAGLALITEAVEPERRKAAFALLRLAINLGMSVGPAAGGFLAAVSFPALFVADGVTTLLAAGIMLVLGLGRGMPRVSRPAGQGGGHLGQAFRDARLLAFLGALLPVAVVFFQHASAMPLFMVRDLGLSPSTYGLMFTLNTVLIVLLEVPLNLAMADWPHGRSLALGSGLFAVGFGAMAFAGSAWTIALTVAVWTFGEMILFPTMSAYVAEIAPEGRGGEYMGLFTMAFGAALVLGPWAGTVVLDRFGGAVLWGGCLVLGMVSAVLMARLRSRPGL